jgi:hypothetical protein
MSSVGEIQIQVSKNLLKDISADKMLFIWKLNVRLGVGFK